MGWGGLGFIETNRLDMGVGALKLDKYTVLPGMICHRCLVQPFHFVSMKRADPTTLYDLVLFCECNVV